MSCFKEPKFLICRSCKQIFNLLEEKFPGDLFSLLLQNDLPQIHWFCKSCNILNQDGDNCSTKMETTVSDIQPRLPKIEPVDIDVRIMFKHALPAGVNDNLATPLYIPTTTANNQPGMPTWMSPNSGLAKCQNFLSTAIRLADEMSATVAKSVRNLIQGIIDDTMLAEEFCVKLQKELKTGPPTSVLAFFLMKNLPNLRHSLITKELTIDGVRPPPLSALTLQPLQQQFPLPSITINRELKAFFQDNHCLETTWTKPEQPLFSASPRVCTEPSAAQYATTTFSLQSHGLDSLPTTSCVVTPSSAMPSMEPDGSKKPQRKSTRLRRPPQRLTYTN